MSEFEIETLAKNIAREFRKYYIKYTPKVYRMVNVKKSKWWPHFIRTAEKYYNEENFSPREFIDIQFRTFGKIFPFFLYGKKAEKAYRDNSFKEKTFEEQVKESVENSKKAILKKSNSAEEYFYAKNFFELKQRVNYLSFYYVCFSKGFYKAYAKLSEEEKNEIITKKSLSTKRALIKQHPLLVMNIKEIMKDDFI